MKYIQRIYLWKILTQVLTHWGLVSVISAQDGAEYPNSNPNLIIPTKNPASKPQNAPYNKNEINLRFILIIIQKIKKIELYYRFCSSFP